MPGSDPTIGVALVDDHLGFAQALALVLEQESDLHFVGHAASAEAAAAVVAEHHPDVVLVDLDLAGSDGLDVASGLVAAQPSLHLVVLTGANDGDQAFRAFRAGARGWVLKSAGLPVLLAAIRGVTRGESHFPPTILDSLLDAVSARLPGAGVDADDVLRRLSTREREVLDLLAAGRTRHDIADQLGVSPHTVRAHVQHILRKLHVSTAIGAVALARREQAEASGQPVPG